MTAAIPPFQFGSEGAAAVFKKLLRKYFETKTADETEATSLD
jgi:hypothetical protein